MNNYTSETLTSNTKKKPINKVVFVQTYFASGGEEQVAHTPTGEMTEVLFGIKLAEKKAEKR